MALTRLLIALFAVLANLAFTCALSHCTQDCLDKAIKLSQCGEDPNPLFCMCRTTGGFVFFNQCNANCATASVAFMPENLCPEFAAKRMDGDASAEAVSTAPTLTAIAPGAPVADVYTTLTLKTWRASGFCGLPGDFCEGGWADVPETSSQNQPTITAMAAGTPVADVYTTLTLKSWRASGFCGLPGDFCEGGEADVPLKRVQDQDAPITAIAERTPAPEPVSTYSHAHWSGFCGLPGDFCEGGKVEDDAPIDARRALSTPSATPSYGKPRPFRPAPVPIFPTMAPEKRADPNDGGSLPLRVTTTLLQDNTASNNGAVSLPLANWAIAGALVGIVGGLVLI